MLARDKLTTSQSRQPEPSQSEQTTPRVLTILSTVIEKLVTRNDRLVDGLSHRVDGMSSGLTHLGKSLNAFHGVRAPTISIPKYLERLYKYTNCSPSCFVVGYVYIDRLLHKHPDSLVISLNVHRLLVTSVMVASKVLDDVHYNNAFYAKVGGVSNAELNRLEIELLFLLDFGVMVSSRIFESYCLHLEKEMLLHGAIQKIERTIPSNSLDDVTEILVEDMQNSSPPQLVD
ncbi:cyclin-U1-1 [Ricinus communis]|uniref:Cyclin n=1 Tax=Ricinus communis TaxID=3988 RepID=B9RPQ9_RICCO|nr:cyclin-U1-1 [Ricinus communis]EEF46675.1 Nuc-1 negative regulatory protein preg, putative [Ricinus communis]|eukprot:XP_002515728.1 cyclin-U1-1 [Ricinus communis]